MAPAKQPSPAAANQSGQGGAAQFLRHLNPKVIQARLGHATITETVDTDGHLSLTPKTSDEEPSTPPSLRVRRNRDGTSRYGVPSAAGQRTKWG